MTAQQKAEMVEADDASPEASSRFTRASSPSVTATWPRPAHDLCPSSRTCWGPQGNGGRVGGGFGTDAGKDSCPNCGLAEREEILLLGFDS